MARITAPTYNWWSLFLRLADPRRHTEAITSRPLLLGAPARLTRHGGKTHLTISHPHAEAGWVVATCREIAAFFKTRRRTAEQVRPLHCRYRLPVRADEVPQRPSIAAAGRAAGLGVAVELPLCVLARGPETARDKRQLLFLG